MKAFPIDVVLSITTGRLLCDMSDIYNILNYMTGDNLYSHQLGRAAEICKKYLLKQYPQLEKAPIDILVKDLSNTELTREFVIKHWLIDVTHMFGKSLDIAPIPEGEYKSLDALAEVFDMIRKQCEGA